MTPQYNNYFLASFGMFIDHEITARGQAFTNYSGDLYPTYDPRYQGYNFWGSPFRQFVADSSIFGANIASGAYQNGTFIPRGTSGLFIDFVRGRIGSSGIPSGESFSASYAIKDFNVYASNIEEERLLFELAPTLPNQSIIGVNDNVALDYNQLPYPCIFYRQIQGEDTPFAFGGLDSTDSEFRCIILSNDDFKLDAAMSILRDTARKYFPVLTGGQLPFNVLGDINNFSELNWQNIQIQWQNWSDLWNNAGSGTPIYNYNFDCANATQEQLAYIAKVNVKRFDERVNRELGDQVCGAIVDFQIEQVRAPRIYF